MRRPERLLALLLALLFVPLATARQFDSRSKVHTEVKAAADRVAPGGVLPVAVVFDMERGWHIWTQEGGTPEGVTVFEGAIFTEFAISASNDAALTVHEDLIQWPEPHIMPVAGMGDHAVFEERAIAFVPVSIPADAPEGDATLTFSLTFQTCDDKSCLMPTFDHEIELTVQVASDAPAIDLGALAGDFEDFPAEAAAALVQDAEVAATEPTPQPAAPVTMPPSMPGGPGVSGQIPGFNQPPPVGGPIDSRREVHTRVRAAYSKVAPGDELPIAVIFDMNPGWHIWTQEGGELEGSATFDGAIHTKFTVTASDEAAVALHEGFVQWPEIHQAPVAGLGTFDVFEALAIAYLPVTIPDDATLGPVTLTFSLTFQTCNEVHCLQPTDGHEIELEFEIVDAALSEAGGDRSRNFNDFDDTVFQRIASGVTPPANVASAQPNPPAAAPTAPRNRFFGLTLPDLTGPFGVVILALLSMLGGFILNLTPCVLPVIPIKIMTISSHAASPGKSFVLGLWMFAGVIAFWAGIGFPVALVSSFTDPSVIFGIWWITLGIGVIIGLMGVGIMGLFMLQLPQSVYAINPKADSPFGSFMFGVMTAVLGLPCFGFIAGALLAGAATLPASTVIIIFTSIGIGMGAPYLLLAAKPSWVEKIPRTGPASELVKQVMGLLLLAAAAYFIGSGLIGLIAEQPHLAKQLHWWAVAILATMAGGWLLIRTFQLTPHAAPRITFAITGVILSGVAIWFANDSTSKAYATWLDRQESLQAVDGYSTKTWNDYTPALLAKAQSDGKIVVLDFTAEWCLICKSLKATVLNRDPVKTDLANDDVVTITVDLTSRKDPGWQLLNDLGKTGIPMLAVIPPNGEAWLSNAYTTPQVTKALNDAHNAGPAVALTSTKPKNP